ncbi:hypothetical protein [Oryza sativa Japonica Group]|uniref:Uncharacterized protein n=1 Tax=Oryza sativa subsp. japonica TaxID=39947 RepID=Q5NBF9_ORYSJ|nr:hypothetical protein [Oryza sativa Japonica Group]BAD81191.1 hypothetical protein [Oryza sativa Japonica Group]
MARGRTVDEDGVDGGADGVDVGAEAEAAEERGGGEARGGRRSAGSAVAHGGSGSSRRRRLSSSAAVGGLAARSPSPLHARTHEGGKKEVARAALAACSLLWPRLLAARRRLSDLGSLTAAHYRL